MTESDALSEDVDGIATFVGRDATGARHRHDPRDDTLYVVTDDGVEHTEDLDGRSLDEWVAFVADRRGWDVRPDTDADLGEWLTDALDGAGVA